MYRPKWGEIDRYSIKIFAFMLLWSNVQGSCIQKINCFRNFKPIPSPSLKLKGRVTNAQNTGQSLLISFAAHYQIAELKM
jgi:hypothetical protein